MITIEIKYFAQLRERFGRKEEHLSFHDGAVVDDVLARIFADGETESMRSFLRPAVNQEFVGFQEPLKNGDELVFITPVAGG